MRALVTGAAGFIGSHFLRVMATRHDWEWVVLDGLRYAADPLRLIDRPTSQWVWHDLRAPLTDSVREEIGEVDYVFHFAAETHVDRSLVDPRPFVESNVLGTFHLLEWCRLSQPRLKMFFYVSTDEVYGPAEPGTDHDESEPHRPSNPYSATKAAGEDLCFAWNRSMGVPCIITNTMNNIGPDQHPEKFVPMIVRSLKRGEIIPVHGTPDRPGSRKYLDVADHADALDFLVTHGRRGEKYNIVGAEEVSNLEMVRRLERIMGREARIKFVSFHDTRPGHDLRYSLDGAKMARLGWTPPTPLDETLRRIVGAVPVRH